MDLKNTAVRINRTAHEKGWWEQDRNVGEVLALIHSEVSEALEDWRNGLPLDEWYYDVNDKPEGFPTEMADIIIRVLDFCFEKGIDIERAIEAKMEFNETRPYRHGGKLA